MRYGHAFGGPKLNLGAYKNFDLQIARLYYHLFCISKWPSLIFCQLSLTFLSISILKNCIDLIAYIKENVLRFWLQSVPCLWSFWKLIESTRILKAEHALVLPPVSNKPYIMEWIFFWRSSLFSNFSCRFLNPNNFFPFEL